MKNLMEWFLRRFTYVKKLEQTAFYDDLTGLLRRGRFFEVLSNAVERARRSSGYHIVVYYIDFNGFKAINDTYGHGVGDKYLRFVANSLSTFVAKVPGVFLGRMGGDEFALFQKIWAGSVYYLPSENGRRIHDYLAGLEYCDRDTAIRCCASVGHSTTVETGFDPDLLIAAADKKMFSAKRRVRHERR